MSNLSFLYNLQHTYWIPHWTILVNWKQSYSSVSGKLNFPPLENSMKFWLSEGPVKLIHCMKKAHPFVQSCVKSVPLYHFRLAYVVLWLFKNFSKYASKNGEIGSFNLESHFSTTLIISCSVPLNSFPEL